ncbi:acyltransferase family protein [Chryseobacterium sp. AG363]|uniref:acyltransferase family protein n=1 Tax=Chryseobacterium sp. AG363 TaxID=2183997 RepID=UPI000E76A908|nr:acyltransferase family protein [Chryseobacterium sp. AG363]RKE82022.1 peptidoglycan/LPS O-acetylase OafA/YrhL [Chryseobacterium sp. AG363]
MKFRNDISFLRAFSVLAVLFYHFGYNSFKGGFIGVDIFFVISGYLMTRIILSGFEHDNFKLVNFYKKRVERIFPAMLFMIVSVCIAVYFLIPTQFIYTINNAYSSTLFFSNIYYYINTGYFDQFSKFNFFLHTWSLSVEWQFYMIYPLILMCFKSFYKSKKNYFTWIFIGFIILSFLLMLLHNYTNNTFSFFITYTRAWEMMFGGLAFIIKIDLDKISGFIKKSIVYLSIGILMFLVYFIDHNVFNWPSYFTLLPVILTTIILTLNVESNIFNNKLTKFLGDISYSLYLWHWPLYVMLIFFDANERLKYNVLFMILSVLTATISYYIIEKRNYNNKLKFVLSFTLVLFSSCFALAKLPLYYFFDDKLASLLYYNSKYKDTENVKKQFSIGKHHMSDEMKYESFDIDFPKKGMNNVILLGDSHAGAFSKTLNNIAKEQKFNLIQFTGDATFPIINSKSNFKNPPRLFNYFYNEYLPKNHNNIDLVIISSFFSAYNLDFQSFKEIREIENYFKKYNIPTLYIGQSQRYSIDYATVLTMNEKYGVNYKYDNKYFEMDKKNNESLKKFLGKKYIDIFNYKVKNIDSDYTPYIYDSNHFSFFGTEQYKEKIMQKINL